jgi:hypothetical protein
MRTTSFHQHASNDFCSLVFGSIIGVLLPGKTACKSLSSGDALIKVAPLPNLQGNRARKLLYTWVSLEDVTSGDLRRTFYAIARPGQQSPSIAVDRHKRNFCFKGPSGKQSRAFFPRRPPALAIKLTNLSVNVMLSPRYICLIQLSVVTISY